MKDCTKQDVQPLKYDSRRELAREMPRKGAVER
jgi:hypothetical protein